MGTKFSFGKVSFDFSPGSQPALPPRDPEQPFCLAVFGDFSGRASRGLLEAIASRKPWHVDCDNFDQVMARLEVTLRLPHPAKPDETVELRFKSLDDFHPDQLVQSVKSLSDLLQCRQRLLSPATAGVAAVEVESLLRRVGSRAVSAEPARGTSEPSPTESNEALLSRLLEMSPPSQPAPQTPTPAPARLDIQALVRNLASGSHSATPAPHQTALLSALDAEMSAQLRAVLHQPAFKELEATWRSLDLLVRKFGGEETIQLHLVNVSKAELEADLKAEEDLERTATRQLLRRSSDDSSWAMLLGLFSFSDTLEDIELLGRLANLAALSRAPWLSAAGPQLAGCDSLHAQPDPDNWMRQMSDASREAWLALRQLPAAAHLGLALPRFLLRQPYGVESDPVDTFAFEELVAGAPHENYLWGNAACLCACLVAEAFQVEGWEMNCAGWGEVTDMPVYRFKQDGETQVKPCAEAWLSERAGEAILEHGLIPVLSIKGRDAVRVASLQSLAGTPLAFR